MEPAILLTRLPIASKTFTYLCLGLSGVEPPRTVYNSTAPVIQQPTRYHGNTVAPLPVAGGAAGTGSCCDGDGCWNDETTKYRCYFCHISAKARIVIIVVLVVICVGVESLGEYLVV